MNSDYDPKGIDSGRLYEAREAARNQQRSVDQLTHEVKHLAKRVAALEESQPGNIRPANWPAVFVRQAASHDAELRSAVTAESARPIPLSERKPGPDDFKNGQAWYGQEQPFGDQDTWDWCYTTPGHGEGSSFTHWLPASTKYLPARMS